jgi:hypothetical protein
VERMPRRRHALTGCEGVLSGVLSSYPRGVIRCPHVDSMSVIETDGSFSRPAPAFASAIKGTSARFPLVVTDSSCSTDSSLRSRSAALRRALQRRGARVDAEKVRDSAQSSGRICQQILVANQQESRMAPARSQPAAHVLAPISRQEAFGNVLLEWVGIGQRSILPLAIIQRERHVPGVRAPNR